MASEAPRDADTGAGGQGRRKKKKKKQENTTQQEDGRRCTGKTVIMHVYMCIH